MSEPVVPLVSALLHESDEVLSKQLLELWISYQAARRGVKGEIPPEVREAIISATRSMDTDETRNMAVAKALSTAARGEFARSGKLLRQLMLEGAVSINLLTELERQAEVGRRFRERQKESARRLGRLRKEESAHIHERWYAAAVELREKNPHLSNNDIAKKLEQRGLGRQSTIRQALPKLGLGPRGADPNKAVSNHKKKSRRTI